MIINEILDTRTARLLEDLDMIRYIVSHDLRKPLRVIEFNSAILKEKFEEITGKPGDDIVLPIEESCSELIKMLDSIANYIKIELYSKEIEILSSEELMEEVVMDMCSSYLLINKGFVSFDKLPVIKACRNDLYFIFYEIIENSVKFSDKLNGLRIIVSYQEIPGYHQFTIENNTEIIEDEFLEIIFLLFQRLHNKEEVSGLGAGLAICKKMVESVGGRIWVEPNLENYGNKFKFTLPIIK